GNSTRNVANIIIAKHRNGAVCDVQLKFINELAKFEDFDKANQQFNELENAGFTMPTGDGFDSEQGTVTRPSRMNDQEDDEPFPGFPNNTFNNNADEDPF